MNNNRQKIHGMLCRFDGVNQLLEAAVKIRKAGYAKFDCHSPFPIPGMDNAMGLKRSPLGWIVGFFAIIGGSSFLALQWWTSAVDYPLVIAGKPLFSFQAYVPVTFAGAVIFAAFSATLGMLLLNRLPRFHHPVFFTDRFDAGNDGFFVSVAADDPVFDAARTKAFLESIGGKQVEMLKG